LFVEPLSYVGLSFDNLLGLVLQGLFCGIKLRLKILSTCSISFGISAGFLASLDLLFELLGVLLCDA
jgi:hypothetical protein